MVTFDHGLEGFPASAMFGEGHGVGKVGVLQEYLAQAFGFGYADVAVEHGLPLAHEDVEGAVDRGEVARGLGRGEFVLDDERLIYGVEVADLGEAHPQFVILHARQARIEHADGNKRAAAQQEGREGLGPAIEELGVDFAPSVHGRAGEADLLLDIVVE